MASLLLATDLSSRRRQLDLLIPQLLPSEVRYVKLRLAALTCPIDFIPKLPIELMIWISDYLTLADLSVARMVSKSWLNCFTRSDVIDHFSKKHFRLVYESSSFKDATASGRLTLFMSLSRRENDICRGNYTSMSCYSYASPDGEPGLPCYDENRVAWKSDEMIFVRNLISGRTDSFVTPERYQVTRFCMRGDFIIGACASSANLYAWSIDSGKIHKIRLPAVPLLFDAKNEKVLISLRNGSVLKWTIGQGVQQLKIPDPPSEAVVFLCCNPLPGDTTFIRCFWQLVDAAPNEPDQSDLPPKVLRFVAEKYSDDCMLCTSSFDVLLSEEGRIAFQDKPSETIQEITKNTAGLDENGHRTAATLDSRYIETEDCNYACVQPEGGNSSNPCHSCFFLRIFYDSIEDRWEKSSYAMPSTTILGTLTGRPVDISSIHFKKNSALIPAHPNWFFVVGIEPRSGEKLSLDQTVMKLRCISGADGGNTAHRGICTGTGAFVSSKRCMFAAHKVGVRYAWAKEASFVSPGSFISQRNEPLLNICGNSTFTVLFGSTGFIVWCYDKSVVLPQQSDEEREILRSWPYGSSRHGL